MPRDTVRLPAHADATVPEWWPQLFAVRQQRIRGRIRAVLARNGRMARSQIIDHTRSGFDKEEVLHAIDIMEREGVVIREDVEEGVGYMKKRIMTITYYTRSTDLPWPED